MPADETKSRPFRLLIDDEDWELLEYASKAEKLSKADTLRRALRHYSAELRTRSALQPQTPPTTAVNA